MAKHNKKSNIPYLIQTVIVCLLVLSIAACTSMDSYDEPSSQPDSELLLKPSTPDTSETPGVTEIPDKAESPDTQDSIGASEPKQDAVEAYRLPVEPPMPKKFKEPSEPSEPSEPLVSESSLDQNEDQSQKQEQERASSNVDDYSLPIDAPEFDPSKGEGSDSEASKSKQAASDPHANKKESRMAEDKAKNMAKSNMPKIGGKTKEAEEISSAGSESDLIPELEKTELKKIEMSKAEEEKKGAAALMKSKPKPKSKPEHESKKDDVAGGGNIGEEFGEENSESVLDNINAASVVTHEHDGLAKHKHIIDHENELATEGHGHHDIYVPGTVESVEGSAVIKAKSSVKWNMQRRPVRNDLEK